MDHEKDFKLEFTHAYNEGREKSKVEIILFKENDYFRSRYHMSLADAWHFDNPVFVVFWLLLKNTKE